MRVFTSAICIVLLAGSISCSKNSKTEINYRELFLAKKSIEYISRDIPYVNSLKRNKDQIFVIGQDVHEINLREKTENILFKDGLGPDEILNPHRITFWDGDFYINSTSQLGYIYKFNPGTQKKKIERVNVGKVICFDDFGLISKNLIVMARVYWKDGLVQIYDRERDIYKKIGTPTFVYAMNRFNVSFASLYIDDGMIYVIESIKPEVKVISAAQAKIVKSLILSPPFYIPIPSKYTAKKYDDKAHREWMDSWTLISDMMLNNGWLLVQYKWGYDFLFGYELINLKDTDYRFYIDKTSEQIYDFSIEGKNIKFYLVERPEEGDLTWETAEASIQ
ncbi:MAG: hypothetical protein NT166_26970 [Candidatus Aminicenantes bacterium]|nr:hypothetical protein [Candidatus Aminicenantes bacterium]